MKFKHLLYLLLYSGVVMFLWAGGHNALQLMNQPSDIAFYGGVFLGIATGFCTVALISHWVQIGVAWLYKLEERNKV